MRYGKGSDQGLEESRRFPAPGKPEAPSLLSSGLSASREIRSNRPNLSAAEMPSPLEFLHREASAFENMNAAADQETPAPVKPPELPTDPTQDRELEAIARQVGFNFLPRFSFLQGPKAGRSLLKVMLFAGLAVVAFLVVFFYFLGY